MVGLLSYSSPDSNKVGINRQLSFDPKVINNLGFIDTDTNVNDLEATNMLTAGELLSCYTSLHADPPKKSGPQFIEEISLIAGKYNIV